MTSRTKSEVHGKWRPALWMVVFGVLVAVAMLPLTGFLLIILFENVSGTTFRLRSIAGLASVGVGSLIVALAVGYVFLRTLLTPVQELISRTGEIERGHADAFRPMEKVGTLEMATLAGRFFSIARRLSDRSTYLTLFTTHVSHELKSPLTAIQGAAELLRDEGCSMSSEQRQRFLTNIVNDAERLALLSTRLRELARAEVAETGGTCDLDTTIKRVGEIVELTVSSLGTSKANLAMSEENAEIVFYQLALNARQHGASTLSVLVEIVGSEAVVKIGDDGVPISDGNREKIFDPFFTTRRDKDGTGMGLGIVQAMLQSHGGVIGLCPPGGRFKFELRIPVVV